MGTLPTCDNSVIPLKLLQSDRSPFLYHFDGCVLPPWQDLSPVPHVDKDGVKTLQDDGFVAIDLK